MLADSARNQRRPDSRGNMGTCAEGKPPPSSSPLRRPDKGESAQGVVVHGAENVLKRQKADAHVLVITPHGSLSEPVPVDRVAH